MEELTNECIKSIGNFFLKKERSAIDVDQGHSCRGRNLSFIKSLLK